MTIYSQLRSNMKLPKFFLFAFMCFYITAPSMTMAAQSCPADPKFVFILDDSGSIDGTERSEMTTSLQSIADKIELTYPNAQFGMVQYGTSLPATPEGGAYDVIMGYTTNPTFSITDNPTFWEDHLPDSIDQMITDNIFTTGVLSNPDAFFIFTDAARNFNGGFCCSNLENAVNNVSSDAEPGFGEYSKLASLATTGNVSLYQVINQPVDSSPEIVQGAGVHQTGNFAFAQASIDAIADSICSEPELPEVASCTSNTGYLQNPNLSENYSCVGGEGNFGSVVSGWNLVLGTAEAFIHDAPACQYRPNVEHIAGAAPAMTPLSAYSGVVYGGLHNYGSGFGGDYTYPREVVIQNLATNLPAGLETELSFVSATTNYVGTNKWIDKFGNPGTWQLYGIRAGASYTPPSGAAACSLETDAAVDLLGTTNLVNSSNWQTAKVSFTTIAEYDRVILSPTCGVDSYLLFDCVKLKAVTTEQCYAINDDNTSLYKFDLDPATLPTTIAMLRVFNGESLAYRATDNALYAFNQTIKTEDNPSDLYKIELDGSETLIASNFIPSRASGAEFVRYSDGTEQFIVLMDESGSYIQFFDATDLASKTLLKTLNLIYADGTIVKHMDGLAINPTTGEVLLMESFSPADADPKIYSVNVNTGVLTHKVTLAATLPKLDAESFTFSADGHAYTEAESGSHRIYRIDLVTGAVTEVENADLSGDIEGMSCTGSKIMTPPPPPPKVYDPKACGVPGFLETFGSGAGRSPVPVSSWSNYDYDEGPTDTNNGAIVMEDQYTVLDKSSIASAGAWWIVDDDHTGDANGRMLMVNADYFAGEFYRQSITGLEVGKKYSFAAHIANAEGDAAIRIPVNVKFSLESGGAEIAFVETGDILQDPARSQLLWTQYELKFTATSTDVDIVLVNNIGGGIGNDLVIDDISISEVCNVCSAFTGEVTEADLPISTQLKSGDKIFVPSKSVSSDAGHLRAYSIDASGIPSTSASWDAAAMMNQANREVGLFSTDASGNIVLFNSNSLDSAAFGTPSLPIATIKANTISPPSGAFLGGISRGNSLEIMTNSMNTSLYLYDKTYRTYYDNTVSSRSKRVFMTSDDGFLYAFNYDTGALVWGWTPRSLVKELENYSNIQQKHLMAGTVEILDLKDSSNNYATYIVGSYKSGLGHYVLKLNTDGTLGSVVWDDDKSSTFVKSPNNGEMEFFRDNSGIVHATYVLSRNTTTSSVVIKSLSDITVDLNVGLNFRATSTPFVMQDYGKSNAPARKMVFLGTKAGDIHAAALLTAGGDVEAVATIKAELESTVVATMDDNPTDEVIYINSSIAARDNRYYLSAQTPTRLTLFKYESSGSSWNNTWTSYVSGAGRWTSGTYEADNSGVPTIQGGFLIVPPTIGIQSLPVDTTITDKATIVADTVVLPISVLPIGAAACYGKAYYYLYSLTDGSFPKKKFFKTDNTEIETNIALGYGEASQLTLSDLLGKDQLIAYGLSDQNKDLTIELGSPFIIKDPVATGIRGWKEIGR